jgi:hypothetical protein
MFERSKIAERLWAQAVMCDEAARLYSHERIAADLERLAQDCREVAFAVMRDEPVVHLH